MKRFVVWVFTDALSIHVNGVRYVPDWNAISALSAAGATVVALGAVAYSVQTLRRQLSHQAELEAKRLEQDLLLRVMDMAQVPYDASLTFVAEIISWRYAGGPSKNPEFFFAEAKRVAEEHRRLSTATAAALHVLRRSRPRRFPRGTKDDAFQGYAELIQRVVVTNTKLLEYASTDVARFDIVTFHEIAGNDAFATADLLRRFTGELLARMYTETPEWEPIEFVQAGPPNTEGQIPFDFADSNPLGK